MEGSGRQESIKATWENILSKFPEQLQQEFKDERPDPNREDLEWFRKFRLIEPEPVSISIEELLSLKSNRDTVLRSPPDIIEEVNKKWGTTFDTGFSRVYDQNPYRVRTYSAMPSNTARPSVMLDGEIIFGVGRFKAALLRGDRDLRVWRLSAKQ